MSEMLLNLSLFTSFFLLHYKLRYVCEFQVHSINQAILHPATVTQLYCLTIFSNRLLLFIHFEMVYNLFFRTISSFLSNEYINSTSKNLFANFFLQKSDHSIYRNLNDFLDNIFYEWIKIKIPSESSREKKGDESERTHLFWRQPLSWNK